jgi:hypothetical protein
VSSSNMQNPCGVGDSRHMKHLRLLIATAGFSRSETGIACWSRASGPPTLLISNDWVRTPRFKACTHRRADDANLSVEPFSAARHESTRTAGPITSPEIP